MNTLRNRVQLIGNLGTAPEIKTLEGGKKIAKLVLATNETHKNKKGEKVTETTWHNLTAWGVQAEIAEKYFAKFNIPEGDWLSYDKIRDLVFNTNKNYPEMVFRSQIRNN